jgi:hypothetical protein
VLSNSVFEILTAASNMSESVQVVNDSYAPFRSESFLVTLAVCLLNPITVLASQSSLIETRILNVGFVEDECRPNVAEFRVSVTCGSDTV